MKATFSTYLDSLIPSLKDLLAELSKSFDYVSILSTDSPGFRVSISNNQKAVAGKNMTTERGTVIRVYKDKLYSEVALSEIDVNNVKGEAEKIKSILDNQFDLLKETSSKVYETEILKDEPLTLFKEKETEELPEAADLEALTEKFDNLCKEGMKTIPGALNVIVTGISTHISKVFLSKNRDLRQSYVYTEGSIAAYARNEAGETKLYHEGVSGCGGPEIFEGLSDVVKKAGKVVSDLLSSEHITPGEYEIITSPEVTGLIAHEAFGHGVEMDMFVKERALGAQYINKRVGSDLVTMHEGALTDESVTAYVFDDEGVLAGDTIEIEKGILKTGICDSLSALRLNTNPTGNGKRESFSHKVYTRMTNTTFDSGKDTLEDMIASIKKGYLLEGMQSGMEDPKHWGIQCIISRGYEIIDGVLTGKVVSPVVMTGYVPDLLGNISMASKDREVFGNGACGKGHKEWVKVADGGPYLKTIARLG